MINVENLSINDYLNNTFECACRREHSTELEDIILEEGALNKIPSLVQRYGYSKVLLISDINTYRVAGDKVKELLELAQINTINFIYQDEELEADEIAYESIKNACTPQIEFVIAVGTGTINDLCKYLSFEKQLEYLIVATAPSMDGFASTVAPMIVDNMKVTFEAKVARAIVGDLDILKGAPMEMIAAGVGDILGKYTCLCDWKMAAIIKEEYYCSTLVEMVEKSIQTVAQNIDLIKERNPDTMKNIMEALILSGIAMAFAGNSRPASGSEHHLSHYWEMMFLQQGKKAILHGTKVGIATIIVLKMYEMLQIQAIDFEAARTKAMQFDQQSWEKRMVKSYGSAAKGVIQLEQQVHKNSAQNILQRLDIIESKWPEMTKYMKDTLPSSTKVKEMLHTLDAPITPQEVGVDQITYTDSIAVAKELRDRYGLLQLLFDLGLSDEFINNLVSLQAF